jgi:hypothetical protein
LPPRGFLGGLPGGFLGDLLGGLLGHLVCVSVCVCGVHKNTSNQWSLYTQQNAANFKEISRTFTFIFGASERA